MATRYLPGQTKDVNIFASGMGLLGLVKTVQLPEVKTKKEVLNGQHVDTGLLEPMEFETELSSLSELLFSEMAKLQIASIKAKGSMVQNGQNKSFIATLTGPIDTTLDSFEAGKALGQKIKMYVNVYHLEVDGQEILNIDLPNYIAKIQGKDIYESIRTAVM